MEASIPSQDTPAEHHVVGNEQRAGAFWKRIAAYFAASPKVAGCEQREASHCSAKRRKCDESAQSSTSHATETTTGENKEGTIRLPGVKASKGHGKKKMASDGKDGKALSEFQSMWNIKMRDLAMKEKLSKMKLLDSLIAKTELLTEYEEALKNRTAN
uniref:No apical meristem-associated C-terminal domain-containing protein n=2 Tax=Brassica oleracea TaxID=3712 RepID=A0A0D2ZU67_BRAOL